MKINFMNKILLGVFSTLMLGACTQAVQATSRKLPEPLSERVKLADAVFLGTLKNKVVKGDWATAELHVDKALSGAKAEQIFNVTWRIKLSNMVIFDVKEGARGIALLKGKHKERYWLRADKFESVEKLAEVQRMVNK